MEPGITVITSITGGYDELIDDQITGGAKFICYTDKPIKSETWNIQPACSEFKNDRLNSRVHKLLAHKFIDTEYGIWIDANMKLKIRPEELIEHIKDKEIAVYEHYPMGRYEPFTILGEIGYCKGKGLADANYMNMQRKELERDPELRRPYMCMIFAFRNTGKLHNLMNAWWAEYTRYPTRDQISFYKIFHGHVDFITKASQDVFERETHYALLGPTT